VSVWAARRADGLAVLVSVVDVGALGAFTLLHASVVGYFVLRRRAPSRAAHVAVPVVGAAVTVWVLVAASGGALVTGALWLGLGAVVFLVRGGAGRAR
jgi:hypothetical protein